jgi:hypothetical protein
MGACARTELALDVSGIPVDAHSVDALARLQLTACRHGLKLVLRDGSAELYELIELMGLADVLPTKGISPRSTPPRC